MSFEKVMDATNWRKFDVEVQSVLPSVLTEDVEIAKKRTISDIMSILASTGVAGMSSIWDKQNERINFTQLKTVDKPSDVIALGSYFGTSFYKDNLRNTNDKAVFNFKVGSAMVPIYSFKGYSGVVDTNVLSTNDAQCIAAIALSKIGEYSVMNGKRLPLAGVMRVQISDDGINEICEVVQNYDESRPNFEVKHALTALNLASCKNQAPFFDSSMYIGELSVAQKIAQLGATKTANKAFVDIQLKQIKRIVKNCNVDLDSRYMLSLINCFGKDSKVDIDSINEILGMAKKLKTGRKEGFYGFGVTQTASSI